MKYAHAAHTRRRTIIYMAAAFLFLVVLSAVIIWNGAKLLRALERSTLSYLEDVAGESVQLVDNRINGVLESLELISDSVARLEPEVWRDFLSRKAEICDFTDMALASEEGDAWFLNSGTREINNLPSFSCALNGEDSISIWGEYIVYMVPLPEEVSSARVLLGIKSLDRMRELITNECFNGQGSTGVLGRDGSYVIPPEYRPFFSLLQETEYGESEDWAVEMLENLRTGWAGSLVLKTKSGGDILLDYRPLLIDGLFLTTLIPKDILSAEVDLYISRTFTITVLLVALFLTLLIAIIGMQNRYRGRIEKMSFHDPVTGGASNVYLQFQAQELIRKAPQARYVVVSLNLRNFSLINEFEGRQQGDRLLRDVYATLRTEADGEEELVARGEADTFYLFLQGAEQPQVVERLERMAGKLANLSGTIGPLRASMGIYYVQPGKMAQPEEMDFAAAEACADAARKSAEKSYHNTCTFYDESIKNRQRDMTTMLYQLEGALERRELEMYLQPKVCAENGAVAGAEALVRWKHPEKGFISPATFIPLCEENGLICQVDLLIFEQVCRCLSRWREAGVELVPVSVNVSRQHFRDPEFLSEYKRILETWKVPPEWIELEITESIMFSGSEFQYVRDFIQTLHKIGFTCSLDDFGSGYSSLSLLKDLPIDCLKLDRQFIISRVEEQSARTVIEMIMNLARKLGIMTVAEGVELEKQVSFLREAGCDLIQGFYFSRPLPVVEFERYAFGRSLGAGGEAI